VDSADLLSGVHNVIVIATDRGRTQTDVYRSALVM
jgi:hypothetical protein